MVTFIPTGQDLPKEYHINMVISIISQCFKSLISVENALGRSDIEPFRSAISLAHSIAGMAHQTQIH